MGSSAGSDLLLVPLAAALIVAGLTLPCLDARADDPGFLTFTIGNNDVKKGGLEAEARVEYRPAGKIGIFRPVTGIMLTEDGAGYLHGGLLLDIFFGRRLVVSPSFSAGLHHQGAGKDLGHRIQFRAQAEIAYRFDDRSRLGIAVSHMSNAGLASFNPGTEAALLTYSIPLGK